MTLARAKLTAFAFFLLMVVLSPLITHAGDPVYVDLISQPLYLPSVIIGATFQNKQTGGDYFCSTGGFLYIVGDLHTQATGTYAGMTTGTLLSDSLGGHYGESWDSIIATYGVGYYGIFANNSLGCPLAEFSQGSSYAYVRLSGTSTVSFYDNVNFTNFDNNSPTTQAPKNIEILNPTYGTTTATTTFRVQIKYKTPLTIDLRPTTTRRFEIRDAVTNELNFSYSATLGAGEAENFTLSQLVTTTEGSKFIDAMYVDEQGDIYSEVDSVFFNVATNTYFQTFGIESPNATTSDLSQIDCDTFDFGCQMQKAVAFLFYPSRTVLNKFSSIWLTIQDKKPFGYLTVTIGQLGDLDTSGTPTFSLGTVPFMDTIFTPIKTAVGGILWVLFALWFVQRRLANLDI